MSNTYNPLQYSYVQEPKPNPQLENFQNQYGNASVSSLQQSRDSNPNLALGDMSGKVGAALTNLQNYADPNQMRDTALSFYSKPINEQYDKAMQQQQNYYQASGFGNSSAKALADAEMAKNRSADIASAAERAQLNSWQYAPNLMQAYGQQAQNLANLAYTPMQQNLQAQNLYGTQFLNSQQNDIQRQQLAQQAQQSNQTAGLESNRLGAEIDNQQQLRRLQEMGMSQDQAQRVLDNIYRQQQSTTQQEQFDKTFGLQENELQGRQTLGAQDIMAKLAMSQGQQAQQEEYYKYLAAAAKAQAEADKAKMTISGSQNPTLTVGK